MLFRFLEYNYYLDEDDMHNPKLITWITVNKNYDTFYKLLRKHIGKEIKLKEDEWYIIDKIIFSYGGNEEDLFCIDVFCFGVL